MKIIRLTETNFAKDESRQKEGAQDGWWGTLSLSPRDRRYGLVKLDFDGKDVFPCSKSEILFSMLAREMRVPCADYLPIVTCFQGAETSGVFSQNFLGRDETLLTASEVFGASDTRGGRFYLLGDYENLIEKTPDPVGNFSVFFNRLFFSLAVMNVDFTQTFNMQLVYNRKTREYSVPPLYDLAVTEFYKL